MATPTAILVTRLSGTAASGAVPVHIPRETLQKRRWRATAEDGTELAVDLTGPAGDGAYIDAGGLHFVIRQAPENVVVIPLPTQPSLAAKIGWYLGNRHIPIEVRNGEMLVEHFPTLTDSLDRIGIGYALRRDVLHVRAHSSAHRH